MANRKDELSIGHFINQDLWIDALSLLDFQIEQKKKNNHYNTLSMHYYEKVKASLEAELKSEGYFLNRIGNNLFYGLNHEFFALQYTVAKKSFGVRPYFFFSYAMKALHYTIGLYLLKLSSEFINENISTNKNILSFYGANLKYEKEKLKITYNSIYFLSYYKNFKRSIRKELSSTTNKMIIKFDIENYFEKISVNKLLDLLRINIKPSIQKNLQFDDVTYKQISDFYNFLLRGKDGIPQTDNDLLSSYISYIYLSFGDLFIEDIIKQFKNDISDYKIIRYADDIYIVINFDENVEKVKKENAAIDILSQIADQFYNKLDLRINQKTKIYDLEDVTHISELKKSLKKVSTEYAINSKLLEENEENEEPQKVVDKIFNALEKLSIHDLYLDNNEIDDEVFKELYDNRITQLLKKEENRNKLNAIFSNFNFELVKFKPKEIMILIQLDEIIKGRYIDYISKKNNLSALDRNIIIDFLCQNNFKTDILINKLKEDKVFNLIMKFPEVDLNKPGYYDLDFSKLSNIIKYQSTLKQIKQREIYEKIGNATVALNHLVNEIHSICYYCDTNHGKQSKNHNINDITAFLRLKLVPNDIIISIQNLFDRRNNNSISHAGTDDHISWEVTIQEYLDYKNAVKRCLEIIL